CRTLMQEQCDFPEDYDVAGEMDKLHLHEAESPDLRIETQVKLYELSPDQLESLVKKMCHGSSAGRTGWTEELLRPVLAAERTRRQMTAIIQMIINDEVAPEIRQRINAARLIAVPKPPKQKGDKPGIRPITVNECFRKIAQAVAVKSVSESAIRHFDGLQYGISVEGGCEILNHRISKGITDCRILVALDAKNAFNTPWRAAIAAELRRNPQFHSLVNQWNFCYSKHTELHFRRGDTEKVIMSQRGTRQGDVLGAFLFALVIHPVLVEAKETFGHEVEIMAYLDDITLIGNNSASMKACVELIDQRFNRLGIELNPSKCEWFHQC
ncbi:MAG: reverse transcriptase domain-containing protein, partial [Solirubrobacteraceae bacterium]|nr:reverse transcriptase domain-containing protein [Solirubrobacteraceae bacterium]